MLGLTCETHQHLFAGLLLPVGDQIRVDVVPSARQTIQGYEAMHMIRKGQARWVSGSDGRRQIQFINKLFGMVA